MNGISEVLFIPSGNHVWLSSGQLVELVYILCTSRVLCTVPTVLIKIINNNIILW